MRKKIFAPVFATAVALSASIVSYASPADYSQQNQDVEKIDMTETQEYQDVRFKTAVCIHQLLEIYQLHILRINNLLARYV